MEHEYAYWEIVDGRRAHVVMKRGIDRFPHPPHAHAHLRYSARPSPPERYHIACTHAHRLVGWWGDDSFMAWWSWVRGPMLLFPRSCYYSMWGKDMGVREWGGKKAHSPSPSLHRILGDPFFPLVTHPIPTSLCPGEEDMPSSPLTRSPFYPEKKRERDDPTGMMVVDPRLILSLFPFSPPFLSFFPLPLLSFSSYHLHPLTQ